jgi:hypothetical protein
MAIRVPPTNERTGEYPERFSSPNTLWEFDPETLTQRRPSPDSDDYILELYRNKLPLDHERAHWFQFCGTTIGATLMTLTRAEDVAVLKIFRADPTSRDIRKFAQTRLEDRAADLGLPTVRPSGQAGLDDLVGSLAEARVFRSVLLDYVAEPNSDHGREMVGRALAGVNDVYAIHTGRTRPWLSGSLVRWSATPNCITGPSRSLTGLSTRHLLESAAVLNELGPALMSGWGGYALQTGRSFSQLDRESYFHVSDRITQLTDRYRRCFDYAFEQWAANSDLITGNSASDVGRTMLSFAACFDIALNPPVVPLCPPQTLPWKDIYPPDRFAAAVQAVTSVGFLDSWPDSADYESYRQNLLDHSGQKLGVMYGRSYQHSRISGKFFKEAEPTDELLMPLSYFDYLIWAMESLHNFRWNHPLVSALPFLMMFNWSDFSGEKALASEDSACFGAPFYWIGDIHQYHRDLSDAVAVRLELDLAILRVLKHVVTQSGPCPLHEAFASSLLTDKAFQNLLFATLKDVVQRPDVEKLVSLPQAGGQSASDTGDSSRLGTYWSPPKDAVVRTVRISRQEIEASDVDGLFGVMAELHQDPLTNRSSLELEFSGYDADPRGLWDIPELRAFLRKFHKVCPIWPWYFYLNPEPGKVVAFALMFFAHLDNPRHITKEETVAWLTEVFRGLNMEADHVRADEQLITEMSSTIFDALKSFTRLRLM